MTTLQEYKDLAQGLNTSLTPITDLAILKEMRVELGISSKPRNMEGWAARTNIIKSDLN